MLEATSSGAPHSSAARSEPVSTIRSLISVEVSK